MIYTIQRALFSLQQSQKKRQRVIKNYFPIQKLQGQWVQAFSATIPGIVWVVALISTNARPPKQSQKSLHTKLVPILPRDSEAGN